MRNISIKLLSIILLILSMFCSCKKYLDEKPDKKLTVPNTIEDLQLLLDNYNTMNASYPGVLVELQSDDIFMTTPNWQAISQDFERSYYIWEKNDQNTSTYSDGYRPILSTNLVLDYLPSIQHNASDLNKRNEVEGGALFFRAFNFFGLMQIYGIPWDRNSNDSDLGIALRLTSDYNIPSERSTVRSCYDRIIEDLNKSIRLLPVNSSLKTRPTRPAVYGILSRVYMAIQDYAKAGLYADSCLRLYDSLINYNTLNISAAAPFSRFNKEVVFHARSKATSALGQDVAKIDTLLYKLYGQRDLRRLAFFKSNSDGTFSFKGDYDGRGSSSGFVFSGVVTDEMYLNRAESFARSGEVALAMSDLNKLLNTRWESGYFTDFTASSPDEALTIILNERRKELIFRGLRWSDLRRLMKEPDRAVVPKRIINNNIIELPVNSPRYTQLLPEKVIQLSNMQQNP